ncbi:MAG TPA: phosphoribosylaminoimidazolesuccinocarboxamide synthase [Patescibacteria group bacterium]|nr:phosphoribosylaminoimidazolesuccinocarboxamide synthase [Patescibacteria group bacterium]
MAPKKIIEVPQTDFDFRDVGQVGNVYHGPTFDSYTINHSIGKLDVVVNTDRVTAFGVPLRGVTIPYKGQAVTQTSAELLRDSDGTLSEWYISNPDQNVLIGHHTKPVNNIRLIIASYMVGRLWQEYSEVEDKCIAGQTLPDNLVEYHGIHPIMLPISIPRRDQEKIFDPTKFDAKSRQKYGELATFVRKTFKKEQEIIRPRKVTLAEAQYKLGRLATGDLVVINGLHAIEDAIFFDQESLDNYNYDVTKTPPEQLNRNVIEEWLFNNGYLKNLSRSQPEIPERLIRATSQRYVNLSYRLTGKHLVPPRAVSITARLKKIETSIRSELEDLAVENL